MSLRVISLSCLLATGMWAAAPVISGVSPDPIDAGGPYFLLTIHGIGFVSSSLARLGATPLATAYVSDTELKAAITPELRTLSGHPAITVGTPAGISNALPLHISPVLSSVSPSAVLAGSAPVTVTLSGIGFTAASVVLWNAPGKPATITPTLVNSGKLTAVIPASLLIAATSVTLQVAEPAGELYSASSPFDILAVPAITSLSPNPVDAGGGYFRLTVTGNGFVLSSRVNLGGVALDTTYISPTQLQGVISPELRALSASFPITVTHPGIATSAAVAFTVSPVLFTLDPASAPGGGPATTLSVTGVGFTRNSVITFNGAPLSTAYISPASLSAPIPASALRIPGLAAVQIADSAGAGHSLPAVFTIFSVPIPAISSLSPTSALASSGAFTLTATAANCPASCNLQWNGAALATSHPSETSITAVVPASLVTNPGPATLQLVNQYGTASKPITFQVYPNAAVLNSLNPPSIATGSPAFSLTINGNGFVSGCLIMWNDTALPTTFVSASRIIGFVPSDLLTLRAGVGAVITVVSPGGAISNALTLALDPPRPAIVSLAPVNAPAGSESLEVVVSGANFAANCVARWNGTPVATTFVDSNHLKISAPAALLTTPGAVPITVTNPSGLTAAAATFYLVVTTPVVASLSPASVDAGSAAFTLTVNGAFFNPSSIVLWNSNALPTTYLSATRLTAAAPANLTAGTVGVVVSNPVGFLSQASAFAVTAPPPPVVPAPTIAAVVNAFSGLPVLAPGALISIYGANLALDESRASRTPLPANLRATSVSIGGLDAPLLFVSPTQINAQLPFELAPTPVTLIVRNGALASPAVKLQISAAAAAVLTGDNAHAVALNYPADHGSAALNSADSPARPGDYVVFYATGQGLLDRAVAAGAEPPEGAPSVPLAPVEVKLGGVAAQVAFAGLAPGFVGLLQINIVVPRISGAETAPGEQTLELTIGNVPAPTARLWVGANP